MRPHFAGWIAKGLRPTTLGKTVSIRTYQQNTKTLRVTRMRGYEVVAVLLLLFDMRGEAKRLKRSGTHDPVDASLGIGARYLPSLFSRHSAPSAFRLLNNLLCLHTLS